MFENNWLVSPVLVSHPQHLSFVGHDANVYHRAMATIKENSMNTSAIVQDLQGDTTVISRSKGLSQAELFTYKRGLSDKG